MKFFEVRPKYQARELKQKSNGLEPSTQPVYCTTELLHTGERTPVCISKKSLVHQGHTIWVMFQYHQQVNGFWMKVLTQSQRLGRPFWDSPYVPIACSSGVGSLIEVLPTLPLQNTPVLEKVQKDKNTEEEKKKGSFSFFLGLLFT